MMRRLVAMACLLGAARLAGAQTRWNDFSSVDERNLLDRLLRAEDARAHTARDLATMRAGLKAKNPALRRYAVRGSGRLERAEVLVDIVPMLDDSSAVVRAAAADALAQGASHDGMRVARAALAERAGVERDPQVLGMIAESMGGSRRRGRRMSRARPKCWRA
jgi:HEAT repeat protein